jgi:hypothetical protein
MLKDQKRAISRLIDNNDFEILSDYPADGVFKENQFVQLKSGVYINVIDSGNGKRATTNTPILCRLNVTWLLPDTGSTENFSNGSYPIEFKYGIGLTSYSSFGDYYYNQGLASGLEYVGDSAWVKLIVPFTVSSEYFNTNGIPLYYSRVRYIFEK